VPACRWTWCCTLIEPSRAWYPYPYEEPICPNLSHTVGSRSILCTIQQQHSSRPFTSFSKAQAPRAHHQHRGTETPSPLCGPLTWCSRHSKWIVLLRSLWSFTSGHRFPSRPKIQMTSPRCESLRHARQSEGALR